MKKVVFVISAIKNDGPNNVLKSMVIGIDREKYDVHIIGLLNGNDEKCLSFYKNLGVNVCLFNINKKRKILTTGRKMLKKWCFDHNPDIVHSHGILPDIINVKVGLPKIIKKVTTIHNNMFEDYIFSFGKLKGSFFIKWHLGYLKRMDKCICCSRYVYDCIKNILPNSCYVQNSVHFKDIDNSKYQMMREEIRKKFNIAEDSLIYVYSGGLTILKNVKFLIEYMNKFLGRNEYLFVLGDGPLKEELSEISTNKNIIFCGFVRNVFDYYSASDVYVSFSRSEGFSMSVLEALEYKNLLLLSDIPSHKEVFEIDSNLYVGECFNLDNFEEMKRLVVKNKYAGKNDSHKLLEEKLNCKKMMEEYVNIYEGDIK